MSSPTVINIPFVVFVADDFFAIRKLYKTVYLTFRMNGYDFFELAIYAYDFIANNKVAVLFPPIPCQNRCVVRKGFSDPRRAHKKQSVYLSLF